MTINVVYLFIYLYLPPAYSFWQNLSSNHLPVFYWVLCFLIVKFYKFFIFFWIQSLCQICDLQTFSPNLLLLIFLLTSFEEQNFKFGWNKIYFFCFFLCIVFLILYLRILCLAQGQWDFSPIIFSKRFRVLHCTFRSFLYKMWGMDWGPKYILLDLYLDVSIF